MGTLKITGGYLVNQTILIPEKIHCPRLRPLNERFRKNLFSILNKHLHASDILDLFSGSGILGFESLSRGASTVTSIESNNKCSMSIIQNIKELKIHNRYRIISQDILLSTFPQTKFHIIFIDPPFSLQLPQTFWNKIIPISFLDTIIILRQKSFTAFTCPKFLSIAFHQKYSENTIFFLKINPTTTSKLL